MNWKLFSAGITLVVLVGAGIGAIKPRGPALFANIHEAKSRLEDKGFHCVSDCSNGQINAGFFVSQEPMAYEQTLLICKVGNMGPAWKGKVWMAHNQTTTFQGPIPDGVGVRVWGKIFAYGDEDVLRDIERRFTPAFRLF